MCKDLLDEDRFGLDIDILAWILDCRDVVEPTWTLAVQSAVMLVILEPDTPGGLSASID